MIRRRVSSAISRTIYFNNQIATQLKPSSNGTISFLPAGGIDASSIAPNSISGVNLAQNIVLPAGSSVNEVGYVSIDNSSNIVATTGFVKGCLTNFSPEIQDYSITQQKLDLNLVLPPETTINTLPINTNNNRLATTAFVNNSISNFSGNVVSQSNIINLINRMNTADSNLSIINSDGWVTTNRLNSTLVLPTNISVFSSPSIDLSDNKVATTGFVKTNISNDMSSLNTRLGIIDSSISLLNQYDLTSDNSMNLLKNRIDIFDISTNALNTRLGAIDSSISILNQYDLTSDISMNILKNRVDVLDISTNTLTSRVDGHDISFNDIQYRLNNISGNFITTLDSSINYLSNAISNTDSSVNILRSRVSIIDASVTSLNGQYDVSFNKNVKLGAVGFNVSLYGNSTFYSPPTMSGANITTNTISDAALQTISTAGKVSNSATTATISNTPNSIVLRDSSGDIFASTKPAGTNTNVVATTGFVTTAISNLVNSAPAVLDTLGEIANALNNDSNFAGTIINRISTSDLSINRLESRILTNDSSTNSLATRLTTNDISTNTLVSKIIISDTSINNLANLIATTNDGIVNGLVIRMNTNDISTNNLITQLSINDISTNSLVTRLGTTDSSVNSLASRLTTNDSSTNSLASRLTTNDGSVNILSSRLTTNDSSTNSLASRLTTNDGSVNALTIRLGTTDSSVNSLATRFTTNDSSINTFTTRLSTIDGSINTLSSRLTTSDGSVNSLATRLTTNDGSINTLSSRLTTSDGSINTLSSRLTTNDGSTNTIVQRLNTIDSSFSAMSITQGQAVDSSSNQTISGIKTFSNRIVALSDISANGNVNVGGNISTRGFSVAGSTAINTTYTTPPTSYLPASSTTTILWATDDGYVVSAIQPYWGFTYIVRFLNGTSTITSYNNSGRSMSISTDDGKYILTTNDFNPNSNSAFLSTDYGATFTGVLPYPGPANALMSTMSSNGQYMGYITIPGSTNSFMFSSNYGLSWNYITGLLVGGQPTMNLSYDGSFFTYWSKDSLNTLYYINTSSLVSNLGASWSSYSLSTYSTYTSGIDFNAYKRKMAVNNDGNIIYLAARSARVIKISNLKTGAGITSSIVNLDASNQNEITAISCSKTGDIVIAAIGVYYYISQDSGATWQKYTSNANNNCDVVCSGNGKYIYISSNTANTQVYNTISTPFGSNLMKYEFTPSTITSSALVLNAATTTINGATTFTNAPIMSGSNITSGSIPVASIVGAVDLLSNQTISGIKTFNNNVVAVSDMSVNGNIAIGSNVSIGKNMDMKGVFTMGSLTIDTTYTTPPTSYLPASNTFNTLWATDNGYVISAIQPYWGLTYIVKFSNGTSTITSYNNSGRNMCISSDDGKYILTTNDGNPNTNSAFLSTDYGATFTGVLPYPGPANALMSTMSSNGQYMGYITIPGSTNSFMFSSNYGLSWNYITGLLVGGQPTMNLSYDGSFFTYWSKDSLNTLYYINTSSLVSNLGASWSSYSLSTYSTYTSGIDFNAYKRKMAVNNDGNIIYLAARSARVIKIINLKSGVGTASSIINLDASNQNEITAISCSKTGDIVIAAIGVYYYISQDSGATWQKYTSNANNNCDVVCTGNGRYMYISSNTTNNQVYNTVNTPFGTNLMRYEYTPSTITASSLLLNTASTNIDGATIINGNTTINGSSTTLNSSLQVSSNMIVKNQSFVNVQRETATSITLNIPIPSVLLVYQAAGGTGNQITITFPSPSASYSGCTLIIRRTYAATTGGTIIASSNIIYQHNSMTLSNSIMGVSNYSAMLVCGEGDTGVYNWYLVSLT